MKENYYALLICIIKPVTIEQGFDLLAGIFTKKNNTAITGADVEDMIRMRKQGFTYREIGEMYGLTAEATYRRIQRYTKKFTLTTTPCRRTQEPHTHHG